LNAPHPRSTGTPAPRSLWARRSGFRWSKGSLLWDVDGLCAYQVSGIGYCAPYNRTAGLGHAHWPLHDILLLRGCCASFHPPRDIHCPPWCNTIARLLGSIRLLIQTPACVLYTIQYWYTQYRVKANMRIRDWLIPAGQMTGSEFLGMLTDCAHTDFWALGMCYIESYSRGRLSA